MNLQTGRVLFTGAMAVALLAGCGDDKAGATGGAAKPATPPAAKTATPEGQGAAPAAEKPATVVDADAQAALDKIPTQEAEDAKAAAAISPANADAEFEKLAKEIEKGDG